MPPWKVDLMQATFLRACEALTRTTWLRSPRNQVYRVPAGPDILHGYQALVIDASALLCSLPVPAMVFVSVFKYLYSRPTSIRA